MKKYNKEELRGEGRDNAREQTIEWVRGKSERGREKEHPQTNENDDKFTNHKGNGAGDCKSVRVVCLAPPHMSPSPTLYI